MADRRPPVPSGVVLGSDQHVLLDGGPILAAAFLEAGFVDEVVWLLAPKLLGAGPLSIGPLQHPIAVDVRVLGRIGNDVVIRGAVSAAAR